jgi:enoyl-[acyl-carrier protein] reductase I
MGHTRPASKYLHATILADIFLEPIRMSQPTGFLSGKKLLITGVLSNRSIAYGIAKACRAQGAELAFSYVGERFKDRITEFAAEFDSTLVFDCDVGDDAQIEAMFSGLAAAWGKFDGFVHAISFAPREAIAGNFLDGLTRENWRIAQDISAYSFPAMAKAALPHLNDQSALLTLSYLGALRAIPNYNTMGAAKASLEASVRYLAEAVGRTADGRSIRVNGISAGPIKTLAASGIKDFGKLLSRVADAAPLRRNVTIDDVGNVAAFMLSNLAAGVTAEITYVDGGFSETAGLSADQV